MLLAFLGAAVAAFVLCWIWVGGYVADFAIWLISKFVSTQANEKNVAIGVGVGAVVLGIIVATVWSYNNAAAGLGGLIAGVGAYIAVRLPGKVREKREKMEEKGTE